MKQKYARHFEMVNGIFFEDFVLILSHCSGAQDHVSLKALTCCLAKSATFHCSGLQINSCGQIKMELLLLLLISQLNFSECKIFLVLYVVFLHNGWKYKKIPLFVVKISSVISLCVIKFNYPFHNFFLLLKMPFLGTVIVISHGIQICYCWIDHENYKL